MGKVSSELALAYEKYCENLYLLKTNRALKIIRSNKHIVIFFFLLLLIHFKFENVFSHVYIRDLLWQLNWGWKVVEQNMQLLFNTIENLKKL